MTARTSHILLVFAAFLAGLVIFLWTLRDGQYEDLDGASERILYDEDRPRPDRTL